MQLILCMAGIYRRFREAGYTVPKFLLPWNGSTVLSAILDHMLADKAFSSVLLLGNQRDVAFRPEVEGILQVHGLPPESLVLIGDTVGQAETALRGIEEADRRGRTTDRRVVFHNIDTVLLGRDYQAIAAALADDDGFIDTFLADSPAYSYVRLSAEGAVTDIAEKKVISRHATTGLYGFASMDAFCEIYASCAWPNGERYISALYRTMLDQGARIRAGGGPTEARTVILGTPAEYESARGAA